MYVPKVDLEEIWSSYADTAAMAAQIGTEAFVPFFSTATAFAAGDWRTAAQEAAFELGGSRWARRHSARATMRSRH